MGDRGVWVVVGLIALLAAAVFIVGMIAHNAQAVSTAGISYADEDDPIPCDHVDECPPWFSRCVDRVCLP